MTEVQAALRFVDAHQAGWGSTQTLGLGALALVLIAAFVGIELRTKAPLVPFPGIFRVRTITGVNITALFVAMSLFSMFFFVSLYMQQVLGYSPIEAGLGFAPLSAVVVLGSALAGRTAARVGAGRVLSAGMACVGVGLLLQVTKTYLGLFHD